jgi:hypothetical protein
MLFPQPVRCITSARCRWTATASIASHCPSRNWLPGPSMVSKYAWAWVFKLFIQSTQSILSTTAQGLPGRVSSNHIQAPQMSAHQPGGWSNPIIVGARTPGRASSARSAPLLANSFVPERCWICFIIYNHAYITISMVVNCRISQIRKLAQVLTLIRASHLPGHISEAHRMPALCKNRRTDDTRAAVCCWINQPFC